ncbi:MAG TPA: peptidylprolyl isomerase [Bryobacteraceae bacterium]|nr:peptidylprolyl isomerase [Bryobacteraceae bacterium]
MTFRIGLACAIAAGALLGADQPQVKVVEEIVAKVNSDIITRGELAKVHEEVSLELQQTSGLTGEALQGAIDKKSADLLRDQIDQLLLVQKGKELNINVDSDVNRRIADIQSQSKLADPEQFHKWIYDQSGMTYEDFKDQLKKQALTQRVLSEEVWRNITIPRAEMQKYYDEHKADFIRQDMVVLRDILVSTGDGSSAKVAEAEKKAKSLVDRARKGEKFTDLARQNSDGPTAQNDGELGSFKKGQLRKEVEDIAFSHDKGYVSDPVRTPAGFEIYRIEERYAAGQAAFDEVENQINAILAEPRGAPKVREYLAKLRENAFMQIKPGYVDSGAVPGKDTAWKDPAQLRPQTTTKEAVAATQRRKFLKVIPYGKAVKDDSPAPPPAVTPVSNDPVPVKQPA